MRPELADRRQGVSPVWLSVSAISYTQVGVDYWKLLDPVSWVLENASFLLKSFFFFLLSLAVTVGHADKYITWLAWESATDTKFQLAQSKTKPFRPLFILCKNVAKCVHWES